MKALKKFTIKPVLPKAIQGLERITKNLFWTWDDKTFETIDAIDHAKFRDVHYDPEKLFGELNVSALRKLSKN